MNTNLNPSMLGLSDIQGTDEVEGQGTGSGGSGGKKKRRRRGAVYVPDVRRKMLMKRQDSSDSTSDETNPTVDRTLVS